MSAGWVAATVRARALARRRLGRAGVRTVATAEDLGTALRALAAGPYGHDVRDGMGAADAERGVAGTLLWHLRVLSGWLPADGVRRLRALAAWFEIADIDALVDELEGAPATPPFRLGALGTAWWRLAGAGSLADLRDRLAGTPWRDPGGQEAVALQLGPRLVWAERVRTTVPEASSWAAGAVALLVVRRLAGGRPAPWSDDHRRLIDGQLGGRWQDAGTLGQLRAIVARPAAWALDGVAGPEDLWRAETAWWQRVDRDAHALMTGSGFGAAPVTGAVAALAVDAWRVRAAIDLAASGAPPDQRQEVLDAVA